MSIILKNYFITLKVIRLNAPKAEVYETLFLKKEEKLIVSLL